MKSFSKFGALKPPPILSILVAIILSAASVIIVSTEFSRVLPEPIIYIVYVGAAISLVFAIWAIASFIRNSESLFRIFSNYPKRGIMI